MRKRFSVVLLTLVSMVVFAALARTTDFLLTTSCEWKCTIWFFFGMLCMLYNNYFIYKEN